MEAFKLAFETAVVGILTLSWIALLIELAKPGAVRALLNQSTGVEGEFLKIFISGLQDVRQVNRSSSDTLRGLAGAPDSRGQDEL